MPTGPSCCGCRPSRIMQYIAPTMIFLTAVFVFGEPFGPAQDDRLPDDLGGAGDLYLVDGAAGAAARPVRFAGRLICPPPTSAGDAGGRRGRRSAGRAPPARRGRRRPALPACRRSGPPPRPAERQARHGGRSICHQRGVVPPAAGDQQAGDRAWENARPRAPRQRRRRRSGWRRHRRRTRCATASSKAVKVVPVQ